MTFTLAPELIEIIRPGVLWLDGARVVDREARLDAPLAAAEAAVRTNPPEEVGAVRTMYKRVGLDPTKTRPSSEALLRRVRKGDALPRINTMVDVCNWCSLEFQLPYGLYDLGHVEGDTIQMRLGRDGESYAGIRKDDVHVGGRICLADTSGPFGNPTSDSARTMVTTATTRALVVVFAPRSLDEGRIARVLDVTAQRMTAFTGAKEIARLVG
ncbi:MAG TPA: phenylalanine--tRNA ligase beta subunit-related protein [Vicinamibacterales bacterium]|jgi:DNA/RNA-binding domain of Phe-tRNA-synthetase-like protein|nr:phenylalanine--tRNA ligase beta subunit-related protein [Vicinamibacterales bacterium]